MLQMCYDMCEGNQFFGLQFGHECWCGREVAKKVRGVCDKKCEGDEALCGGAYVWKYLIFEHLFFHVLGC